MIQEARNALEHVLASNVARKVFWGMDKLVDDLVAGIRQGDDAVVVGELVINIEGPYPLKIGRKTALIHTCSDVVVMGGKPLFALNAIQAKDEAEVVEAAKDLKRQSDGLGVPIVGGNTQIGEALQPSVSVVVVGKLVKEPIPDGCIRAGDVVMMLGEVVEGEIGERVRRAKTKFEAFIGLIEQGVRVHAAKDCSRGGWLGNLLEMLAKSKCGLELRSIPYRDPTRYLGTYLVAVPPAEREKIFDIAAQKGCPVIEMGSATEELGLRLGRQEWVKKEELEELISKLPYKPLRRRPQIPEP